GGRAGRLDLFPGRRPALVLPPRLAARARPADTDTGRLRVVLRARADRARRRAESGVGPPGDRPPERPRTGTRRNARALRDRCSDRRPALRLLGGRALDRAP